MATARPPAPPPAPPVILDRFRAMVKTRQRELGGDEEAPVGLSGEEIVRLYEVVLAELICNSKPVITELTMIAGDHREHAEGIAEAICQRVLKVPVDQKLPSLYLLDSIVKNIGREYVRHFGARLQKVFCKAYSAVNSNLHPAMRHLFETWSQFFPSSVLCRIEDELQFTTPLNQKSTSLADTRLSESPSSRPSHGIHVNPKYLEARRQLENHATMHVMDSQSEDSMDLEVEQAGKNASKNLKGWSGASPKSHDVQQPRGVSASLQVYGHKPSIQYDHYNFEHTEALGTRISMSGVGPRQTAALPVSSMIPVEDTLPHFRSRGLRPLPSPRIGLVRSISPVDNRLRRDISPGRADRASPSRSGCGHARVSDQNGWVERRWSSEDDAQQRESSIRYNPDNGTAKQRSRELIDAYGNYKETGNYHVKSPKVQRLNATGMNGTASTRNRQSSEEEEYMWDMSPTLADRSNRNRLHPFGNGRPGLNRVDDRLLEPDFRRSWQHQALLPPVDVEDRIPAPNFDRGSINSRYLDGAGQVESLLHCRNSHHPEATGQLPHRHPHYSPLIVSPTSQGREPHMPYLVNGLTSTIGQKQPGPYVNLPDVDVAFRRLPNTIDRFNAERPTIQEHLARRPYSPPRPTPVSYPSRSELLPLLPISSDYMPFKTQYEFIEGNKPVFNNPPFMPSQQYDFADRIPTTFSRPDRLPHQLPGPMHARQPNEELSSARAQPQWGSYSQLSSHFPQPVKFLNHASTRGQDPVIGSDFPNQLPDAPSVETHTMPGISSHGGIHPPLPGTSSHAYGGVLPPLPPGPPPASSQATPACHDISFAVSNSPASSISGLLGTLVAKGLINLKPPDQSQDFVGVEFNVELLKVRHEPVVNDLYSDLPRQCTTCGLRFKCQEVHSSHMDWHVTKNRVSKNRKQKPSRKWFVNAQEWLSGAEILGIDVVPGFLPTEAVADKKEDKEMNVPADENQIVCALCGELFEDFYSDDTEEWMYRGAVYLNSPNGNIEGVERSLLGPIVHAKCRPESAEDTGQP